MQQECEREQGGKENSLENTAQETQHRDTEGDTDGDEFLDAVHTNHPVAHTDLGSALLQQHGENNPLLVRSSHAFCQNKFHVN